jgi:hypothetical protein
MARKQRSIPTEVVEEFEEEEYEEGELNEEELEEEEEEEKKPEKKDKTRKTKTTRKSKGSAKKEEQDDDDEEQDEEGNLQAPIELDQALDEIEPPPLLPAAQYRGEITNAARYVSNNGKQLYAIEITIPVEEFPADFEEDEYPDGVVLTYRRLMWDSSRGSLSRVRKFMEKTLGLDITGLRTIEHLEWIGHELLVTIGHNMWEGEKRMEIVRLSALDD